MKGGEHSRRDCAVVAECRAFTCARLAYYYIPVSSLHTLSPSVFPADGLYFFSLFHTGRSHGWTKGERKGGSRIDNTDHCPKYYRK